MWLWLLLLALACGGPHASPPAASIAPPAPPDGGTILTVPAAGSLYHGVLPAGDLGQPDDPGTDASEQALAAYEQAVGRKVAYVYFSDEWMSGRAFPAKT